VATPFAEPAHRTYQDAETLLERGRLATPDHLYGLACECALKAILWGFEVITTDPPKGKLKSHINVLWAEYMSALSGRAANGLAVPETNPFQAWKADHRYCDDSQFTEARVLGHKRGADIGMELLQRAKTQGIVK
jgi:hypothetical protein